MDELGARIAEQLMGQGGSGPHQQEAILKAYLYGGREEDSDDKSKKQKGGLKSQQLVGDPFEQMAAGEFIPPRFDPNIWAASMEQNTRLGRSIRLFARNTMGLGWYIEPLHKINEETPDDLREAVEKETKILQGVLERPNDKMPLSQVLYMVKVDEESTGNGYLEIVRDVKGRIAKLYHIPSVTVRIRAKKNSSGVIESDGFVQIRGNEKRYFKDFRDSRVVDAFTGEEHADVDIDNRASEIIHFMIYSPLSTWYGAPRYVSAAPAITGNRLSSTRNVSFFENDAMPRMVVTVTGGRLDGPSMQMIEDFFKTKQLGVENSHRAMVLQVEQQNIGFQGQGQQPQLNIQPLNTGGEDASFLQYRQANDEEIREAFGIAPVFFNTENVNKASAQVSREITNEQEFEPDRLEKEYILNELLISDILGTTNPHVRFRLERMKLTDPMDTARTDQTYAGLGALTANELRESIGKPPYPDDFKFANKPMAIAMAELSMQMVEAILGDFKRGDEQAQQGGGIPGGQGQDMSAMFGMGGEDAADLENIDEEKDLSDLPETGTAESTPYDFDTDDSSTDEFSHRLLLTKRQKRDTMEKAAAFGVAQELMREARNLTHLVSTLPKEIE